MFSDSNNVYGRSPNNSLHLSQMELAELTGRVPADPSKPEYVERILTKEEMDSLTNLRHEVTHIPSVEHISSINYSSPSPLERMQKMAMGSNEQAENLNPIVVSYTVDGNPKISIAKAEAINPSVTNFSDYFGGDPLFRATMPEGKKEFNLSEMQNYSITPVSPSLEGMVLQDCFAFRDLNRQSQDMLLTYGEFNMSYDNELEKKPEGEHK